MQYDVPFEICKWNVYFHPPVEQHTGHPAAKGVHFLLYCYQLSKINKHDCYISSMTHWKWSGVRKE
jgi:hypothetical protein